MVMVIAVSACLLGENCKYNGGNNYSEKVRAFCEGHEVIPICPEVMGGLPTPRVPAEIVNGVVTNKEGKIVDKEFRSGAEAAFNKIMDAGVEVCILQSRSPSCGVKEVYDGSFTGKKIPGMGVFAQKVSETSIKMIDVEDLD
ncbi:Uncharacterized conserved protein YbbK, DUF523 family [Butyrivibrio hungatei]|uniref:Uncharacterized conserved protein YbbK, DUF523 family n=2 Tax=Lachnospiraceae TaxID=186803 RepID=A0A1G5GFU6_9FIRM|nr:DUF523 domain-containing protein [Butyrivibrio sp. AE2005]SCY50415.1 Uncharacterized conserved protein YbbK, DUF523 family [Butyrivibrio hungatei]